MRIQRMPHLSYNGFKREFKDIKYLPIIVVLKEGSFGLCFIVASFREGIFLRRGNKELNQ